jgi:hypothetical protein
MAEAQIQKNITLSIGKQKLLREVRENADAIDTLIDHAVEHTPLAV